MNNRIQKTILTILETFCNLYRFYSVSPIFVFKIYNWFCNNIYNEIIIYISKNLILIFSEFKENYLTKKHKL